MASSCEPLLDTSTKDGVLSKLRENTARFVEMNAALGGLFTQKQAALLLGLGTTRVGQLVEDGRLHIHEFSIEHEDGETEVVGRYISGKQIERFLAVERKPTGRPSKLRMAVAALAVK